MLLVLTLALSLSQPSFILLFKLTWIWQLSEEAAVFARRVARDSQMRAIII